jgi:hypothetical protein
MRFIDSPHYEDWRQAVIEVAQAQWALDDGRASPMDVERAAAKYDQVAALLHDGPGGQ